jgi:uncharacterized protein YndB with AHSA1/START domain
MNDQIERQVHIDAPAAKVWAVITSPEHIGEWFTPFRPQGDGPLDLRPGATMTLELGDETYPTVVVQADPPHLFSYRWAMAEPGNTPTDDNSTLVEFTITADGDGSVLRVVESGFARLAIPADDKASLESHTQGWPGIIDKVRAQAELIAVR